MMSRPSSRTQRRYGVSFSVANFLASSCETTASLAMSGSLRDWSVDGDAEALARRRRVGYGDALLRLDAQVHGGADGRAQRRVRAREQQAVADLDLEIEVVAEEHHSVDRAAPRVVAVGALGRVLEQLHVLGAHRHDHRVVAAQAAVALRL